MEAGTIPGSQQQTRDSADLRAAGAALAQASREAQGLPPTVTDQAALAAYAAACRERS